MDHDARTGAGLPGDPGDGGAYDVVVVGGGPAGLSAALVLARARRSVLVVDSGQPRNAPAAHAHGYLTRDGVTPGELLALGRQEVEDYGARVVPGRATALRPGGAGFALALDDGTSLHARAVVVATGLRDRLPELPGVAERWGTDVLHCPYCHGHEVSGQRIAVLGEEPHAAEEALLVRQWSDDVVLLLAEGVEVERLHLDRLAARGVEVVRGDAASLRLDGDALAAVVLADGAEVACRALVVAPRLHGADDLLRQAGAATETSGFGDFVVTEPSGLTSVPGLYATGNVASPAELVVDAVAAGSRTAIAVNFALAVDDADQALAAQRG